MKFAKILILIFIAIITFALIYAYIKFLGMQGFLFANYLNFTLMACIGVFTEKLKSKNTSNYFNQKVWENNGKIYKLLGINVFRKLLVWIGWEKLNKKANPVNGNMEALTNLEYNTKQSELAHLIVFFIVLGFTIYVIIEFSFIKSLWLIFLNILFNVYPIFLQRYNRPRLQKAFELNKQRRTPNSGFNKLGVSGLI